MPYDHAKFTQHAKELRGLLGPDADGLSDRAVVERALTTDERVIAPETKQFLRDQYGESAASSFGKSFVRSTMLDSLGDLVGLGTSKYTETNPIQDDVNTYARMGGGLVGMLALQAVPGIGQAATGGRIGAAALRAALQAGAGANTNWREQEDQMAFGDRLPGAYSPMSTALAATTSGAGQLIGAGKYLTGKQDKAWEAGRELAKKAWQGGIPKRASTAYQAGKQLAKSPLIEAGTNVVEEGVQAVGEGMLDDRNLSPSGLAAKAPLWQRLAVTGGFGAAADLGINRTLGGLGTYRKPDGKIVTADQIDVDNPGTTYKDLTDLSAEPDANPAELTDRVAKVEPNQQPFPEGPLDDSHIPFTEINAERDSPAMQEANNRALLHFGRQRLIQMEEAVAERRRRGGQPDRYLIEHPDPNNPGVTNRISVYQIGDEEVAVRRDSEGKLALYNITRDPEMGDTLDLRSQSILQYLPSGKDRKKRAFLYAGKHHRPVPGVGGKRHIEYTHEGRPWKVVTHRPDPESGPAVRRIGAIPLFDERNPNLAPAVPPGMHRIREFELDSLNMDDQALQEALAQALAAPRARRKGTKKKPALTQSALEPIDEAVETARGNQAARELLRHHKESGAPEFDLTDQGPVIPPIRGLGGEGGTTPPPTTPPPPTGGGSPSAPPGATPSSGKPVTKLDPTQLPPLDPEVLMAKWDAGGDLTPEERAFLVAKGVMRQAPISGGSGMEIEAVQGATAPNRSHALDRDATESLLVNAGETMEAYYRSRGKNATAGGALVAYVNALGADGIKAALQYQMISPDEARHYLKLLGKTF